ncbi:MULTISPECIES: MarR family winged helix-turn-helix transcriptional regulator [unclassified Streptomyces]|uniref:MarR family winged helix-turn-helix transcriptional regulator n=1 Tax=unclassified Streptomyces TaxID=2593676 RepID=UPI00336A71B3
MHVRENDTERVANLLGAAALAITDDLLTAPVAASSLSMSAAAALIVLHTDPGVSVTELGRRVGLTQSAAVRMVDGLERGTLVERRRTLGNWTGVHPTSKGRRTAEHLLSARTSHLATALDALDRAEVRALGGLLEKLLDRLYQGCGAADRMCRLCDRAVCTPEGSHCPVGAADRAAQGRTPDAPGTPGS